MVAGAILLIGMILLLAAQGQVSGDSLSPMNTFQLVKPTASHHSTLAIMQD
jgi:hypothetical protein